MVGQSWDQDMIKYPHITIYIPKDRVDLFIRWGRKNSRIAIYGKLLCLIAQDLFERGLIAREVLTQVYGFPFRKGRPTSKRHRSNHYSFAIPERFRESILAPLDALLAGQNPAPTRSVYIWDLVRRDEKELAIHRAA